tara:strand:- start:652 stop:924 length:273 start_codon:yes stop_codon:yes gene_type:complete
MYKDRQDNNRKKLSKGSLVRVEPSPDTKVRVQDNDIGHLQEISWSGEPIVGVVTRLWGSGMTIRELELLSDGQFLLVTTNTATVDLEVLA